VLKEQANAARAGAGGFGQAEPGATHRLAAGAQSGLTMQEGIMTCKYEIAWGFSGF
jgi:hypothetical protein